MMAYVTRLFAGAVFLIALANSAIAAGQEGQVITLDPVVLIQKATVKYQGGFKVGARDAVAQMDSMLTQQYLARGRIANERDAHLKGLYYQSSVLLMNGYPIAGGTIVSVARNDAAFQSSPVGPGFASFVDAMLQPTDEDPDLLSMHEKTLAVKEAIKSLRPNIQFFAELQLVGAIYHDAIAQEAGAEGIKAIGARPSELKTIARAKEAIAK